MNMKNYKWIWMAVVMLLANLAGCGGGGGGTAAAPQGGTVIKGTASKGIIYPGTVNVYAVDATGTKGARLASVATAIDGTYTASLGAYSGAVQVEASGTYTDEATGRTVTIAATKPLHTLVDLVDSSANNNRTVAVTALTEVAWRKASGSGTKLTPAAAITSANKLVDDLFKVTDIVGTEPVRPDTASMAHTSQEVQAYTLALSAISQMAAASTTGTTDLEKLEAVLSSMELEVEGAETSGSMSATATTGFASALSLVPESVDYPSAAAQLSSVGTKSQFLTLTTSGTLPTGAKIYAIQGTIALPANPTTSQLNVLLRADSNGQTLSDVFALTGVALGMGSDPVAMYLPAQQQVNFTVVLSPSGTGIGTGDFAILAYDVVSGATVTAADFSIVPGSVSIKDANGAAIAGITVTLK